MPRREDRASSGRSRRSHRRDAGAGETDDLPTSSDESYADITPDPSDGYGYVDVVKPGVAYSTWNYAPGYSDDNGGPSVTHDPGNVAYSYSQSWEEWYHASNSQHDTWSPPLPSAEESHYIIEGDGNTSGQPFGSDKHADNSHALTAVEQAVPRNLDHEAFVYRQRSPWDYPPGLPADMSSYMAEVTNQEQNPQQQDPLASSSWAQLAQAIDPGGGRPENAETQPTDQPRSGDENLAGSMHVEVPVADIQSQTARPPGTDRSGPADQSEFDNPDEDPVDTRGEVQQDQEVEGVGGFYEPARHDDSHFAGSYPSSPGPVGVSRNSGWPGSAPQSYLYKTTIAPSDLEDEQYSEEAAGPSHGRRHHKRDKSDGKKKYHHRRR